ncbi:hypothetical protein GGD56_005403 [Rhizobium mongolense]|uniref:Uncharacterized protein n=2 Tax=Rhizobium mongolense TaxID=57676 RepID=A0ABR6IUD4_9HYPH|nr:hypothetical protein [Rhizobium mongolense]TVZ64111.1 hypothetical protein BCL32_4315 [Rhizobium mongolense USDA 1844]
MTAEPRFEALKQTDKTWTIIDRRTGQPAERSGLILVGLEKRAVLGLIQILEQIEDAPKRIH